MAEYSPGTIKYINQKSLIPESEKHQRKKTNFDVVLADKFSEFYDTKWTERSMYTPSDFINEFGINRHLARYYLMLMVYEKKLFRVKYSNKTFYAKRNPDLVDRFKEYIWMGVEVT